MKKAKIGIFFGLAVVLAGLGLFFGSARAKAALGDNTSWNAPAEAKVFRDVDGKGVRVYVYSVYADEQGKFNYARVSVPKTYNFAGTLWELGTIKTAGNSYFDDSSADLMAYYLSQYGSGKMISLSDRSYFYFDVDTQKFYYEYRGDDYLGYLIGRYASAYSEGYAAGYSEGVAGGDQQAYQAGYSDGFNAGQASGYDQGYEVGRSDGFDEGYDLGLSDGRGLGYDEGYEFGYGQGYDDGVLQGYESGRSDGYRIGYEEGESAGYERGYEEGESAGYDHGYDTGYDLGLEIGREEGYENGYNVGHSVGHDEGYDQCLMDFGGLLEDAQQRGHDEGYSEGFDAGYDEASSEIYALGSVIPAGIGSIWLVVRDFLSIEVLGMAIWEIIAAFVAIGVAILLVRMFL